VIPRAAGEVFKARFTAAAFARELRGLDGE
jgi:hypothetical protein